ncbi:hypothetical protein ACOME3_008398 [Neoechinorhynchus agilis]
MLRWISSFTLKDHVRNEEIRNRYGVVIFEIPGNVIAGLLETSLGGRDSVELIRISKPLKDIYAKLHNLGLEDLMTAGPYKEIYRQDMISFGEHMRVEEGADVFINLAITNARPVPIWIFVDCRRKSDIDCLKYIFNNLVTTIRVWAPRNIRRERGWAFKKGVDDAESECDLDQYTFDCTIENNENVRNSIQNLSL